MDMLDAVRKAFDAAVREIVREELAVWSAQLPALVTDSVKEHLSEGRLNERLVNSKEFEVAITEAVEDAISTRDLMEKDDVESLIDSMFDSLIEDVRLTK